MYVSVPLTVKPAKPVENPLNLNPPPTREQVLSTFIASLIHFSGSHDNLTDRDIGIDSKGRYR